jgi:hypothetical protein
MFTVALGYTKKKAKLVTKFLMLCSRNFWTSCENCRGNGNVSTISTKIGLQIFFNLTNCQNGPMSRH